MSSPAALSQVVASTRNAAGMVTVDVNGPAEDDDYAPVARNSLLVAGDWNSVPR